VPSWLTASLFCTDNFLEEPIIPSAIHSCLLPFIAKWNLIFVGLACVFCVAAIGQTKKSASRPSAPDFKSIAEQAEKASEENRLDEAAVLYRKALALKPRWAEGWWSLGTLEYDQDHYAKATLDFKKVIGLNPENGTAHAMLGLCQFELGQDEPALNNLLAAEQLGVLKDDQLRKVALYHLGLLELRAGKYGVAKETLGQLVRDRVRTPELTTGLGLAALLIRPKDSPLAATPGADIVARAGEAEVLLASNEFDRAKQIYAQLTNEFPEYPNLHFAFGRLLVETHEADEAVAEFQQELLRDPQNVNSMLEIAAARQLVDAQGGLRYAEDAVKLAPGLPLAHYLLGMLRLETGDAAAAIPELEIAQKSFPKEAGVYFALGKAYSRMGRKADATKARAEFARLNSNAAKPPVPTVYGERPGGLLKGQLSTAEKEKPRQ
jgi:predicted Zn-dependent protease